MFIKLVANSSASNSGTSWNAWTQAIKNFLDGTWTATSSLSSTYFNVSSCQVIGSRPLCDDGTTYSAVNVTRNSNTSNSSDNYIYFDFNHAERTASYTYKARASMHFTATGTYGARFRHGDALAQNYLPYNNTSYYTIDTSSNGKYTCNYPQETAYIWFNKHAFVIQQFNGSHMVTMGIFGYDASAANEYQYTQIGSARHAPFASIHSYMRTSAWNTGTSDHTSYERLFIGANTYLAPDNSVENLTQGPSVNYHNSYSAADNNYYMGMTPNLYKNVYPLRTSTGHIHQLIPAYMDPHFNSDLASYPFNGRFKTLYRTSDNIAAPGTTLTYDGTQYAVWMIWKTGGAHGSANNVQNACFLIPTTVDGR